MKRVCVYEQAPALYIRVIEYYRVYYPSSKFWTCPFSNQTRQQVESRRSRTGVLLRTLQRLFISPLHLARWNRLVTKVLKSVQ